MYELSHGFSYLATDLKCCNPSSYVSLNSFSIKKKYYTCSRFHNHKLKTPDLSHCRPAIVFRCTRCCKGMWTVEVSILLHPPLSLLAFLCIRHTEGDRGERLLSQRLWNLRPETSSVRPKGNFDLTTKPMETSRTSGGSHLRWGIRLSYVLDMLSLGTAQCRFVFRCFSQIVLCCFAETEHLGQSNEI